VPETVQSRCQVFEFKKPTRAVLASMTAAVAKKEGYSLDTDAADLIAMLAEGSYRDALSILQKVFSGSEGKSLTRTAVEETTGAPKRELVHALISALAAGERGVALVAIENAAKSGADMKLFLELVLEALRTTLLLRYAPELRASLETECGADEFAVLEKFAKEKGISHATMLAFLTAADRIRYAPIPALPLELAVLELSE
jgi:DNA polymerase-3 subunit gamma/tau